MVLYGACILGGIYGVFSKKNNDQERDLSSDI